MGKKELRKQGKKTRIFVEDQKEKSRRIIEQIAVLIQSKGSLLAYYPTTGEVDIKPLLAKLFRSDKKLYAPKLHRLEIGIITSFSTLVPQKYRYYEPLVSTKTFNLDCALIPGILFDRKGVRLGHGTGWYDMFLYNKPEILKIGICFDEQLVNSLPSTSRDIPMDIIVTDEQTLTIN